MIILDKYCGSCSRVFKGSDFKICPYCGNRLDSYIIKNEEFKSRKNKHIRNQLLKSFYTTDDDIDNDIW